MEVNDLEIKGVTPAPHLTHCNTETIPGKSFVSRPEYPNELPVRCPCGCEDNQDATPESVSEQAAIELRAQEYEAGQRILAQRDSRPPVCGVAGFRPLNYLACPYSTPNAGEKEWRFKQATLATAWLTRECGDTVFSPITHSHPLATIAGMNGAWADWKKFDMDFLAVSGRFTVLLLDGWQESVGVQDELKIAQKAGIKVQCLVPLDETGERYRLMDDPIHARPLRFKPDTQQAYVVPCADPGDSVVGHNMRVFDTGATRDTDQNKPDYEGFLSPLALEEFGRYMTLHQKQADGTLRTSDNWQKGIPKEAYIKSMWRHFFDAWKLHRHLDAKDSTTGAEVSMETALCALLFNVQGYLHEHIKGK